MILVLNTIELYAVIIKCPNGNGL